MTISDEDKMRIDEMLSDLTPDEKAYAVSCLKESKEPEMEDDDEEEVVKEKVVAKPSDDEEEISLDEDKMFGKE